jgi:hypothetical protein
MVTLRPATRKLPSRPRAVRAESNPRLPSRSAVANWSTWTWYRPAAGGVPEGATEARRPVVPAGTAAVIREKRVASPRAPALVRRALNWVSKDFHASTRRSVAVTWSSIRLIGRVSAAMIWFTRVRKSIPLASPLKPMPSM